MSRELHDVKNILRRLEIQAELLAKKDFSTFSRDEILKDAEADLKKMADLMKALSNDQ